MRVSNALAGLAAIQNKAGGAYRLYELARHLDAQGSGRISKEQLHEALEAYGVNLRSYQRWTRRALQLGVFQDAGEFYEYISNGKAAAAFHALGVSRAVEIDSPALLFDAGWHGIIWACFIEGLNRENPTSRAYLEEISGVPIRTQQHYEKQTDKAKVFPSYALRGKAKEYKKYQDPRYQVKNGQIVEQLPNVYTTSFKVAPKGMLKKHRQAFRDCSLHKERAETGNPERRYFKHYKAAQKAARTEDKFYHLVHSGNLNYYGVAEWA